MSQTDKPKDNKVNFKEYYNHLVKRKSILFRRRLRLLPSSPISGIGLSVLRRGYSRSAFPAGGVLREYYNRNAWNPSHILPYIPLRRHFTTNCGMPLFIITACPELTEKEYPQEAMDEIISKGRVLENTGLIDKDVTPSHILLQLEDGVDNEHINAQRLLREFSEVYELFEFYKGSYIGLRKDAPDTDVGFFYA